MLLNLKFKSCLGASPKHRNTFYMGRYTVKETVQTVNLTLHSSLGSFPRLPTTFANVFDYDASATLPVKQI